MQRSAIRGADLKPNPSQHVGMLNAEKCIRYLRGIGVEIDDATADAWLDTQGAHRFLRSERASWRRIERWSCYCGAMQGFREMGRGRVKHPAHKDEDRKPPRCEDCNAGFVIMSLIASVRRDGTVEDLRRGVDAVIPLRLDEFAGGLCS